MNLTGLEINLCILLRHDFKRKWRHGDLASVSLARHRAYFTRKLSPNSTFLTLNSKIPTGCSTKNSSKVQIFHKLQQRKSNNFTPREKITQSAF